MRRAVFTVVRPFSPVVAVDVDGARYLLSTSDSVIAPSTFSWGPPEQDLMAYAVELLGNLLGRPLISGRTFVDIGANIGTATIPAISVFGAARGIAFEPAHEAFLLLECNVGLNGLRPKVQTFELALSDRGGTSTLELSPSNSGDNRVRTCGDAVRGRYGEAGWEVTEVRLERFDDVAGAAGLDLSDVGLVWVDTQGHEGHVLAGAQAIITSDVPVILEYWPYGLRRAGGLSLLHEIVTENYETVIDLRASMAANEVVTVPARRIRDLESRYGGTSFTDLALLP